jgi:hypothetical protein
MNKYRFIYVEVEKLKEILSSDKYSLVLELYSNYIYFKKYLKLMVTGFNCQDNTYIITSPKSTIKKNIILFEIGEEHAERYSAIRMLERNE